MLNPDDLGHDDRHDRARADEHRKRVARDAAGRTPPLALRRASGHHLPARVEMQVERDALISRLAQLDDGLLVLSDERSAIVHELAALRDSLYPPVTWCHGRRPPDLDRGPLPPAPNDAMDLAGRSLRATCVAILRRHGALSLEELHGLLHRYGYLLAARRPVAALSDAMSYEVERGRARRVERGVYAATDELRPRRTRRPPVVVPEQLEPWLGHGPSALDPDIDEDPPFWQRHRAR